MDERVTSFLKSSGWANAALTKIAGDLSDRKYFRLRKGSNKAVLMECASENDPSLPKFIMLSNWLRSLGLSAPEIYAADAQGGLAVLQDFGDSKLTTLIAKDPDIQKPSYEDIVDTLITIRNADPPLGLATPSAQDFCDATTLADTWYPGADLQALDAIRAKLETVLEETLKITTTVSLRDFHADNIIWLGDNPPARRAGLLDFQDAILTHPAYDLMSLLTDARTDVSKELSEHIIQIYCRRTGDNVAETSKAIAALGVQRNLRILGIFTSAARRDAKPHHLPALPRVYAHLITCASHPALSTFATTLRAALPKPTPDYLAEIAL